MNPISIPAFVLLASVAWVAACSSSPPVRQQEYAALSNRRTMGHDFPTVWKGIEKALKSYRIVARDPDDVEPAELRKLDRRSISTDWINGRSRDKYIQYKVNGSPHRKYLQTRIKYRVLASKVIGGTDVQIDTEEEIENLKPNGDPSGWSSVSKADPSRAHDLLERIQLAVLSE